MLPKNTTQFNSMFRAPTQSPLISILLEGYNVIKCILLLRSLQESGKFVNQFPNENSLLCKDLLATVCQNVAPSEIGKEDELLRRGPEWLPVTFNLNLELPLFLDHYIKRKKRCVYFILFARNDRLRSHILLYSIGTCTCW